MFWIANKVLESIEIVGWVLIVDWIRILELMGIFGIGEDICINREQFELIEIFRLQRNEPIQC